MNRLRKIQDEKGISNCHYNGEQKKGCSVDIENIFG